MKKIFVVFITFSLFISSLCTIDGCKTEATGGLTCTTCNDGYLLVNDAKACFYGCKTEDTTTKGTCAACNDGYLKVGATACLYGCKTETSGECTACNDGYKLTLAKTCIKGCDTADTTASSAKCSKCTTEANISTDGLSCIANCKTTGHNSEVCSECKDGYTLSSDKASCTVETKKDGSFGLRGGLLIFVFLFLF
jgi:hypothetical protein